MLKPGAHVPDAVLGPIVGRAPNIGVRVTKARCFGQAKFMIIKILEKANRANLKVLRRYFPYTSKQDRIHQTTDLPSYVWHLIHPERGNMFPIAATITERLAMVNDIFKFISIGTNQIMVMNALTVTNVAFSFCHRTANIRY